MCHASLKENTEISMRARLHTAENPAQNLDNLVFKEISMSHTAEIWLRILTIWCVTTQRDVDSGMPPIAIWL